MLTNWFGRSLSGLALVLGLALTSTAWSAEAKTAAAQRETVEMFAAIKAGDIEVLVVPKDAKQATVVVTNKTKKPLSVKMPEAFAGVPVLAQFGGGGGFGGNQGGFGGGQGGFGGGGGMNQSFGGGFGGGGGGFGGGGGGFGGGGGGFGGGNQGGFFNVEPEKAKKVKLAIMCLEHGKKDPNLKIKYEIVPIESFTSKPNVIEICKMLGRGEVDQASAQAAAWHYTDGLSWQELAYKVGAKHLDGRIEPFFTAQQIEMGMKIAHMAGQRAEKGTPASESQNTSSTDSLSQAGQIK